MKLVDKMNNLTEKKSISDVDIKKIEGMTANNDHTGSRLYLAKLLKNKKLIKAMEAIQSMHRMFGSMPPHLINFRDIDVFDMLMQDVKKQFPDDVDKIKGAF